MKKILTLVLMIAFGLFGCYDVEQNVSCSDTEENCIVVPIIPCPGCDDINDFIEVSLSPDSPKGEIPPGNDRLLAIFTINSDNYEELYGLDLAVANNYPEYYWFVDELWLEDETGNVVFPPQTIYDGFAFWGFYDLPAGETRIKVMGHVTFGEAPDAKWNPRPEIRIKVNGIYASTYVAYANLQGNLLTPKYSGYTYVSASLSANAPSGQVFEGMTYEVYRFDLWTDQASTYFSYPEFEYNKDFDGELLYCSLWEGNTLIADQSNVWAGEQRNYLFISPNSTNDRSLITTEPRTFSVWCQVETNSDNQNLQIRLSAAHYETGPEGNYNMIPPPSDWNSWTFILMDQLYVSLATDTPQVIVPGVNVTLMKFNMVTSAGEAKLYSLPFLFLNRPAGVYGNCHIEDENNNTLNVGISGYDNGGNSIYETYFMGPSDGVYPGEGYSFTIVGTTMRTFKLVCDVAAASPLATTIQLQDVYYYQVGTSYYDIKPDTFPIVETWVIQP